MPGTWPDKDPDDILDYGFVVEGFDDDVTLSTSTAVVVTGTIAIDRHDIVPGTAETVTRLSGGVDGQLASVRIRSVMSDGERVDMTMNVKIAER